MPRHAPSKRARYARGPSFSRPAAAAAGGGGGAPGAGDWAASLREGQDDYVALGVWAVDAVRRAGGEARVVAWGGMYVVAQELAVQTALWPVGGAAPHVPWDYFHARRRERDGAVREGVLGGVRHAALAHAVG